MRWIASPCLLVVALLAGCGEAQRASNSRDTNPKDSHSSEASWQVRLEWETGPKSGSTDNVARIVIAPQPDSGPHRLGLTDLSIEVTPWMTVHGHGSGNVKPVVDVVDAAAGIYRVKNIYFVMSGPWDLRIAISGPDGTTTVVVPVAVPAS